MGETGKNKKVAHSLVALSSAAVLAVYSAGYQRTKAAADRFERMAASRRHAVPASTPAGTVPASVAASPLAPDAGVSGTHPTAPGVTTSTPGAVPGTPVAVAAVLAPASAASSSVPAGVSTDTTTAQASGVTEPPVAPVAPAPPVAEPLQAENAGSAEASPITPPPRGRFKDGTYQGRGSCIHGDIQAEVVVKNGRITTATISSCETRYSCDWLDPILPQVVTRQSAFVDYVSGATDSTDAFSAAVTDALLKAQ